MSERETIGVFFGSRAPEHDVSIITGTMICAGLKGLGYNVVPVYISKGGEWYIDEALGDVKNYQDPNFDPSKYEKWHLDLEASRGKMVLKKKGLTGSSVSIDLAFPAFHGQYGEDGVGMGVFQMFGVPFVGCDHASSALAMDKVTTKLLYQRLGYKTADFVHFLKHEWQGDAESILETIETELSYPLFVKPARLGSSIGIAKVGNRDDLKKAIEVALHYEEKVLVEVGVSNMKDITCALLGDLSPRASVLQDASYGDKFFSYEDKYIVDGGAQFGNAGSNLEIPANVPEDKTNEMQEIAKGIFTAFGCSGTSRVDFLYDTETKEVYVNEINTLPGTLYHHLWEKSGVDLPELLEELLKVARSRHERIKEIESSFASDILNQGTGKGGSKLGGSN